ncbi:MAG: hypothetical protein JNK02_02935 [Planctomycetes bacterium]|nr:hypothetical protein [Planctomycetota bacterium]
MQLHRLALRLSVGLGACAAVAQAQTPSTPPLPQLVRPGVVYQPASTASFLASTGSDDCATADVITGQGVFPFNNSAATTSPQGQTEGPCLFFGSTAMNRDVWFTWTAPVSGLATLTTCGLTTVDTKIAVYPGSTCPTAGTVLACNDDACASFQSSLDFNATSGNSYMIQIGVYPTAAGGTGTFSLTVAGPPGPPVAASMNVDIGSPASTFGVPTSAYGAAAAQPGVWNARSVAVASALLNDLSGAPCNVQLTRTGTSLFDFSFDNAGTTGNDQALLDDAQDAGGTGATTTWTFGNLFGGNYQVYTYAWAPDSATYIASVSVAGSSDPAQNVGGTWTGSHALGVTYARHAVAGVASGGSIAITISTVTGFATVNGFQIVREGSPFTAYCFGDGTGTACPCGNSGAAGNGCENSVVAAGANLSATGTASVAADTVTLLGTGMPNSSCLYFQGTTQISAVFGDGIRCAGGTVIRLGTKSNVGGGSQYPAVGDPSVSVRGLVPPGGGTRYYQVWYRNAAAFCTPSTFNLSNGLEIPWGP